MNTFLNIFYEYIFEYRPPAPLKASTYCPASRRRDAVTARLGPESYAIRPPWHRRPTVVIKAR
jgi:hypothetical protein